MVIIVNKSNSLTKRQRSGVETFEFLSKVSHAFILFSCCLLNPKCTLFEVNFPLCVFMCPFLKYKNETDLAGHYVGKVLSSEARAPEFRSSEATLVQA